MNQQLRTPPQKREHIDKYRASREEEGIVTLRVYIPAGDVLDFRLKALRLRNEHRVKRGLTPHNLEDRMAKYRVTPDTNGLATIRVYLPKSKKEEMRQWAAKLRSKFKSRQETQ